MESKTVDKVEVGEHFLHVPSRNSVEAGRQWLTPIILATWEAEIRRIVAEASLCKYFKSPHLQNYQNKMDRRCGSDSRESALQV
jgi:hypothetical protein